MIPTARRAAMLAIASPFFTIVLPGSAQITVHPQSMPKTGEVDSRFLSFNVEAVEVTGGNFWKPYKAPVLTPEATSKGELNQPAGMDAGMFRYRPPIDLSNPKLRKLAAALAPTYMRVSGTWRNSTYFQNDDKPALASPPEGFKGVMTRAEWKGVVSFSQAVHADLVTSVAMSAGTRNTDGVWTSNQAKEFFDYTKTIGGHIAATEFMNEPTFAMVGGAPQGYDAASYARDVKIFADFLRSEAPQTLLLGPGSIGEGVSLTGGTPMAGFIKTPDMMAATGPIYDVFSFHFYPAVSRRCAGPKSATTPEQAMKPQWFERNLITEGFYEKVRNESMPGKPLWLTETGEAGCGGDPFASQFLDTFRLMDQLGSLAQKGVQTVMLNTLASSDYGLVDEDTLEPRPSYWAGLLWKRIMGTRVLNPGVQPSGTVRMYAHCSVQGSGGVAMVILNLDKAAEQIIDASMSGEEYALSSSGLLSSTASLNGQELRVGSTGAIPELKGKQLSRGPLHLAPQSITFLVFPKAKNSNCK